jgi:adenylate cyclase
MESPQTYIPTDRRLAIAQGVDLPEQDTGAALFADISGFTPLTELLVRALGPQRGAEELPRQLNLVYDALIVETDRYGGSVIGFSGDAITCWFSEAFEPGNIQTLGRSSVEAVADSSVETADRSDSQTLQRSSAALRAAACALAIQQAMAPFASIEIAGAGQVSLGIKVAVTVGPARRFVIGDPQIQRIDALAGATIARLAAAEHQAERGDVMIDEACVMALGEAAVLSGWRADEESGLRFAMLERLSVAVEPTPWPSDDQIALSPEQVRPWLLPPVFERLSSGMGEFLTELRPAVALFLRFGGIDYDGDASAGAQLDSYIIWAERVLERYGGFLLQLTIGDKGSYFYAAFGAPLTHEDNATRAALAALALLATPPELAYVGAVQIGVSQGRMRTGAYGGATRRTYGVLGDDVNMAARLMQAAPPGQIYVSAEARKPTQDAFIWWRLAPIRVKGKSQPIILHRLLEAQERRTIRLQAPRYALPMIGRAEELATITQLLEVASAGVGQIVGVTAEAGVGKSRLVAEVIRIAQARGAVAFGGECQAYGTNTSYLVWRTIWRAFFGVDQAQSSETQIATLERELSQIDAALLARLPLLGAVLNLDIPDSELTAGLDAKLRRSSLEALLITCLLARAAETPLLIVLEDAHWLDSLSHDLLEAIGRAISGSAVLLLIAYRPPQVEQRLALRVSKMTHFTEVSLGALAQAEIEQLLRSKLANLYGPEVEALPALIEQVSTRAQGNPFYVEELLNYLHDRGIDPRDTLAITQAELPASLHGLILSRIDQLSENQKVLIKVASVIGRLFRASMLWGVFRSFGDADRLRNDLDILSQVDLTPLDTPDPELMYLFKHVMTQEVAYESLPFATRAVLHDQIGLQIEHSYAENIDQAIDLLAFHFSRTENIPKQRTYLLRAGELAQADYANPAALSYYERVMPLLDGAERAGVLLRVGQVHEHTGQWDAADSNYQQALALAEESADVRLQQQCQIALGELRRRQGGYAEAAQRYSAAQGLAEQIDDQAGIAKALICLGTLATQQGDYVSARERYGRSMAIRQALDDQLNIANVLNNLCIVAYYEGDYPQARALQEQSLGIRRTLRNKWALANSLNNLGAILSDQGDLALARQHLDEAIGIQREIGDPAAIALTLHSLANLERTRGTYDAAVRFYHESIMINMRIGDRWTATQAIEDLAWLAALQEDAERALRLAGAASAARAAMGAPLAPGDQARLDAALAPARQALGDQAASVWEAGQSLTFEQAAELALA